MAKGGEVRCTGKGRKVVHSPHKYQQLATMSAQKGAGGEQCPLTKKDQGVEKGGTKRKGP